MVEVRLAGYRPFRDRVRVVAGSSVSVAAKLHLARQGRFAPWKWVSLGAGGALLLAGIVTAAVGEGYHADVARLGGRSAAVPGSMSQIAAQALIDDGNVNKAAGAVCISIGGAGHRMNSAGASSTGVPCDNPISSSLEKCERSK